MAGLTDKQAQFVREYLIDLNATQAYRRAGYNGNENVCAVEGHKLLSNPKIASEVSRLQAERAEKCDVDALWVLREAKATYLAARDENKLSEAVSALKLVGAHVDVQAFKERVGHEHTGKDGGPIQHEQVQSDADAFESSIAGLVARGGAATVAGDTQH